jgi:23S rRNA pseudouridine1911/1915/1917 synthase
MEKILINEASDSSQKLEKFIKKYLPNAPLGGIYKMLRIWKIKVNWKKKEKNYTLEMGDEISIFLGDDELLQYKKGESLKPRWNTQTKGFSILYEDEHLMVVNKSSGLNVHPGDHKSDESSLIEQVQDSLGNQYNSLTFRPSLVHRIDRETSGCVMIAKDKQSLESLLEELQWHKIEKIYHAIIIWIPKEKEWTIKAKIERIENARNEAKVQISENGQSATTHYRVLQSFAVWISTASLIECRIETGRTHQIRVHMKHIGHPLCGDRAYWDKGMNSFLLREYALSGQLLHAHKLIFTHPKTGKKLEVTAPYPESFEKIIQK